MVRVIFSLLALGALTAFAPAPFPKAARKAEGVISLTTFQGRWRLVSMRWISADGNHRPYPADYSHVKIKDDTWSFQYDNGDPDMTYPFSIDNTQRPAHIDLGFDGKGQEWTLGKGIIRKKGDVVEILVRFRGTIRPVSFEQPAEGQYWLTLRRIN